MAGKLNCDVYYSNTIFSHLTLERTLFMEIKLNIAILMHMHISDSYVKYLFLHVIKMPAVCMVRL